VQGLSWSRFSDETSDKLVSEPISVTGNALMTVLL
jgi:hypothetical protein